MPRKRFISCIVVAPGEVTIREPFVHLERGVNTFNTAVEDIDVFKQALLDSDVVIRQVNILDDLGPLDDQAGLVLPSEVENGSDAPWDRA